MSPVVIDSVGPTVMFDHTYRIVLQGFYCRADILPVLAKRLELVLEVCRLLAGLSVF